MPYCTFDLKEAQFLFQIFQIFGEGFRPTFILDSESRGHVGADSGFMKVPPLDSWKSFPHLFPCDFFLSNKYWRSAKLCVCMNPYVTANWGRWQQFSTQGGVLPEPLSAPSSWRFGCFCKVRRGRCNRLQPYLQSLTTWSSLTSWTRKIENWQTLVTVSYGFI